MGMESKFIWMNGELVPFEKATMHVLTPAIHYGAAVFEGIRAYDTPKGPAVFRLTDHAERLLDSARVFGFRDLPWTTEQVVDAVKETVKANGFKDCYIRPLLYLDGGGWNLNVDNGKPSLAIATWEWGNYLGEEAHGKRHSRQHLIVHASSPERDDDQGQGFWKLCKQFPCQDRVRAAGFPGSHHARSAGICGRMHGRESFHGAAWQDHHAVHCACVGRRDTSFHSQHRKRFGISHLGATHLTRPALHCG